MRDETVKSNIPKTAIRVKPKSPKPRCGQISSLHRHDELELILIYEGAYCITVYGKDYIGKAGEVIFVNSGVPHETRALEPAVAGLLQFNQTNFLDADMARIIKYSVRLSDLSGEPVKILRSDELFKTVEDIFDESTEKCPAYDFYIKSGIYRIMGYLYRAQLLSDAEKLYNRKEMQKILPALTYINSSYADDITLEEVSAKLNFDSSYFCRLFKRAVGATFTEYLSFVRVCKAEKLLSETNDSIIDISEAVGFSSASYFNRVFKRFRGCTPRYYRETKYRNEM